MKKKQIDLSRYVTITPNIYLGVLCSLVTYKQKYFLVCDLIQLFNLLSIIDMIVIDSSQRCRQYLFKTFHDLL